MNHSIQRTILVWLIVIIASIGALVGYATYSRVQSLLFTQEKKSLEATNIEDAKQVGLVLDNTALFAKIVATQKRVVDYLQTPSETKKNELQEVFDVYQKDNFAYLSIYLMDSTGSALISTDRSFIGVNYGFRPYFTEAMKGHPSVDMAVGKTTKKLGYYFSHPVLSEHGSVLGVIAVKLEPTSIYRRLDDSNQDNESTIMITNLQGVVLFSTKNERELKTIGKLSPLYIAELKKFNPFEGVSLQPLWYEEVEKKIQTYTGPTTVEMMDHKDSERELISISRVKNYPFYFITEKGLDTITSQIGDIARTLGIGVFGAALLSLVVISLVIQKVLSPLGLLKEHAQHLGDGDFSKKLKLRTGDELEELAVVFNKMSDNLRELYTGLEKKVEEKVQELELQLAETHKTKLAMFNLLEDVNSQKAEIEAHAVELQKFQLAVENAHDHIVITDADGIVVFANKAVETITGYTVEEVLGKKAGSSGLWGGHMEKSVYESFWNLIKKEKKTFVGEFTNIRKNGEQYVAEAHVSPILDANGNVIYFMGIERDITRAKEVDRMKTEFISLASHQLRTPLSAMKWFLEMLLHGDAGKLNDEQTEFVNNIDQSNNRMIELVNSLLNVSRIESGRIIIEPKPTNLKDLVEEVLTEVKTQYKAKKQTVIFNIHNALPLIPLDQKLIRQVYLNLLTNAMKYSPPESEIIIFISKENDKIVSQITDSGYGIPKNEQSHIFTKFYRATNAVKKETEGNGLGLYLVQSIIESSGGKIWFTSDENQKGTSFYFSIPLAGMKEKAGEVHLS
jgi:PAS domain S-box-containing protein